MSVLIGVLLLFAGLVRHARENTEDRSPMVQGVFATLPDSAPAIEQL